MNVVSIMYQTACGAIAAVGFGVLFNVGFRMLSLCASIGAMALAVRGCCQELGMHQEGATFVAALCVASIVQLLRRHTGISQDVIDVAGCIAMVPGSLAAKAIIGLFALTSGAVANESDAR